MPSTRTPLTAFVTLSCVLTASGPLITTAQAQKESVPLDGIVALVGIEGFDESVATAVLASDVAFFAKLLVLHRNGQGASGQKPTPQDYNQARRIAVLVNLLGKTAKQLGEKVSNTLVENTQQALTEMAGGSIALSDMRNQLGISREKLLDWVQYLALVQVLMQYEIDSIEPAPVPEPEDPATAPSSSRTAVTAHQANSDSLKHVRSRLNDIVHEEHVRAALKKWLEQIMETATIRLVK